MNANGGKSYLPYLNKLVDQGNNTYHHSINKKPINADYSYLTEKIDTNHKAPKFKVNDRDRIMKYENIFIKVYTESWSREIFVIDSVLKTNPWTYKIKDLNGGTYKIKDLKGDEIIGSLYEKRIVVVYVSNELLCRTRHSH